MSKPTKFKRFLVKVKRFFVMAKMETVDGGEEHAIVGKNMVDVLLKNYDIEGQTEVVHAMQLQLIAKRKEQIEATERHLERLNKDLKINEDFVNIPTEEKDATDIHGHLMTLGHTVIG